MIARALTAAAAVLACLLLAACSAELQMEVQVDRDGRGELALDLALDSEAQAALGLSGATDEQLRAHFEQLLVDGGWVGDGVERISVERDADGGVVLRTRHPFDDLDQLERLITEPRPIALLAPDAGSLQALTDLPEATPLLNSYRFRLRGGTGDNPGFRLFARGGVGEIGGSTCAGSETVGFGSALRNSLLVTYRMDLPGGPGDTNANSTPLGTNVWDVRYGDCPALTAASGGGGSSRIVNGVILAVLVLFLIVVFGVRALRRRRRKRAL